MKHEFNNFSMFKFDINPHANYQSLYSIKKKYFLKNSDQCSAGSHTSSCAIFFTHRVVAVGCQL